MSEFLSMGGYAIYVWPSYIIVAIVLYGNVVAAKMQRRRVFKALKEMQEED